MTDTKHLFAVIMAGGKGERFWPAGRAERPKQLLPLLGEKTMLEETVQRLFPLFAPERILVIANRVHADAIRELLPIPAENVVGEPEGRDTAPCAALATALIRRRDPEATMVLLPADHVIRPAKLFQDTVLAAAQAAQKGVLVTLGVTPTEAASGYGYLHLGEEFAPGFHRVLEFREKPDPATARIFFQDGNYRWNSGIFIWRCDAISRAFARHAPEIGAKLEEWSKGADYARDFAECPKISLDYAVMEKADNVVVRDVNFYWNDIGSWGALRSVLELDASGNAVRGKALTRDASGNVIWNDSDLLIGVVGLNGVAVVKSGNGLLVCALNAEQQVKELVHRIREIHPEHL